MSFYLISCANVDVNRYSVLHDGEVEVMAGPVLALATRR